MESNDSSEVPDRGETSDIPGLPSGVFYTTRWTLLAKTSSYLVLLAAVYGKRRCFVKRLELCVTANRFLAIGSRSI